jgi:pimeloyl-ACP methyl ester carboxylesterase
MAQPGTRFATVGPDRIAYQVFGEGSTFLLHIKPLCGSVDLIWENVEHLRLWRTTRPHLQLIVFDHRGTGVSDPLPESVVGMLSERVADAIAVIGALGLERVAVSGEGDGVMTAIKLAAEHPDRVDKLILINGQARGCAGPGYDLAPPPEVIARQAETLRTLWGTGAPTAAVAPNLSHDLEFAARFERSGAPPATAAAWVRNQTAADVLGLLDQVQAPTLVVFSGDMLTATEAQSRHLAESIPGARVLVRTSSGFYWGGGVVEEMIAFVSDSTSSGDRELATVLFTDVVDSTGAVIEAGGTADGDRPSTSSTIS